MSAQGRAPRILQPVGLRFEARAHEIAEERERDGIVQDPRFAVDDAMQRAHERDAERRSADARFQASSPREGREPGPHFNHEETASDCRIRLRDVVRELAADAARKNHHPATRIDEWPAALEMPVAERAAVVRDVLAHARLLGKLGS